ncbi:MAG: molybdenum ABC transporter ATP-binding protein [Betaproteobacteria bacterium]
MSIRARFHVAFPDFVLDANLDLPGRGVSALFGHSGSGKTTCLRAIAGLEGAPDGYLEVNGDIWQDDAKGIFIPTHQRPLGVIFQDAALFTHLSVRQNLEYGQRRIKANKRHIKTDATIELLGIGSLLDRMPEKLSGGEKSRVAMARALLTSPSLLLMDEPLAALDIKRKQEILPYLERLHDELSIPVIYVSHAPDEVARLADHLVLLEDGQVIASGPISETLARTDLPPAFADDAGVVLETTVSGHEADNLSQLDFVDGSLHVGRRKEAPGSRLRCRIHARDVSIALEKPRASSIVNILPAIVTAVAATDTPGHVLVQMRIGSTPMLARITERSQRELGITPGQTVWAQIKGVALLA